MLDPYQSHHLRRCTLILTIANHKSFFTPLSEFRGTLNLIPLMKASVVLAVGIVVGDTAGYALPPLAWLLAALATALLAWWARDRMILGSILIWLTIGYLGAFSMSFNIATEGPRQRYKKAQPTVLQESINEVRMPLLTDARQRLAEEGMTAEAIGMMTAMTLAERSGIDSQIREEFSIAGASHVLALSGLHVGIIAIMLGLLLGGRHRRLTEVVLIVAIWGYVLIAGMPISAVRAALMLTIWSIISLSRRSQHPLNVLGTAILLMLIINPATLFDVAFQLSCSAVFFLLLCMPFLMNHCPWKGKVGQWLWGLLATSFVAQMATAPLIAFYFGRFSVYSLLTNIVAVPLTPIIIVVALLVAVALLLPFTWLLAAAVWVENSIVALLLSTVHGVALLPGASFDDIHINSFQVVLIYVLIFCVIAIIRRLTFSMDFARNI